MSRNWNGNAPADNGSLFVQDVIAIQGSLVSRSDKAGPSGPGYSDPGAPQYTLTKTDVHAVAFEPGIMGRCGSGHTYPELSGTLRKDPGDNQMAVAFDCKASGSYGFQESPDTAGTLRGAGHGGGHGAVGIPVVSGTLDRGIPGRGAGNAVGYVDHLVATPLMSHGGIHDNLGQEFVIQSPTPYQVRRLTPVECARLQGFPDYHTRIPWRNKPAEECPDGPQYKAYGNSMCTRVMFWLGKRIMECMLSRT
jgi:DNA (cytosine-5)-methyltransferase 1